jgi:N-methylhydantoinase B
MGRQVLFHAGTTSQVIKAVIRKCAEDPGINDGDMFIVNNPYDGAVHPPDVSIVCPIFSGGELVAWSVAPHSLMWRDGIWQLVPKQPRSNRMHDYSSSQIDQKKIRRDIWEMILSMSRLPFMIGLDFKAMIAANNLAKIRLTGIMKSFGLETVQAVMNGLIEISEKRFRTRLLELPRYFRRGRLLAMMVTPTGFTNRALLQRRCWYMTLKDFRHLGY